MLAVVIFAVVVVVLNRQSKKSIVIATIEVIGLETRGHRSAQWFGEGAHELHERYELLRHLNRVFSRYGWDAVEALPVGEKVYPNAVKKDLWQVTDFHNFVFTAVTEDKDSRFVYSMSQLRNATAAIDNAIRNDIIAVDVNIKLAA